MTATDELRRILDERGVEWHGDIATYWRDADAVESLFADNALDVSLYAVSPEQAIEATLGRGTCEPVDGYDDDGEEIGTCCSECGSPWPVYYVVRYCPVCGCKVVES